MLLVMSTQGIFDNLMTPNSQSEVESPKQQLWRMTWIRIETNFIQELFPSFTPPISSKAISTITEEIHSEERESKERQNDSLSSAVTSLPVTVAIPATVSRGNASPPPAPNVGSPS